MRNLERKILKWIGEPGKFAKKPDLTFASKNLPERMPEANLEIRSLECIRKNELSKDEIVIYLFWLAERAGNIGVEGIIHKSHDFRDEGEKFDLNLNIPLNREKLFDTFCILVYEEDAPLLFDFHDPIGFVSFHQNQGIAVYEGDFREVNPKERNFKYNSVDEIEFDAGSDGQYRLVIDISSVGEQKN